MQSEARGQIFARESKCSTPFCTGSSNHNCRQKEQNWGFFVISYTLTKQKWPSAVEYRLYTGAADKNPALIKHSGESFSTSSDTKWKEGAAMEHTNTTKWEQWHASFNFFSSIKIIHQAEPSLLECVIGNEGTLNPSPGHSIHLQHATGLGTTGLEMNRWTRCLHSADLVYLHLK